MRTSKEAESIYYYAYGLQVFNDNVFLKNFNYGLPNYNFEKLLDKSDFNSFQNFLTESENLHSIYLFLIPNIKYYI